MGGRAEIITKCSAAGSYKVKIVDRHKNETIQYYASCLPSYTVKATLFTIEVNTSSAGGSSIDPMALKFPSKTGYIEDTANADANDTACTNYDATKVFDKSVPPHYLGWTINPDPLSSDNKVCSKYDFTFPNGDQATIYGRLFGLNGQYFRHDVSLATLEFNKTYQMDIGFFPHPFHHHINPFQFAKDLVFGFLGQKGEWRDVVSTSLCNISNSTEVSSAVVRVRTRDFKGNVVMHCHYLPHEDRGLMGYYIINDTCTKSDHFLPVTPVGSEQCGTPNVGKFCQNLPSGSLTINSLSAIMFALFMGSFFLYIQTLNVYVPTKFGYIFLKILIKYSALK
ncbi:Multicopper oxidase family [Reticulomyxa filosa]|uniref:Multicopper oxidase family n=1 Tax=Reticulomyxa filosa TaxID=46433 RepID=X6M871_RETFI|nr:Multicopper oxidase family [Reticulomyxa filosa]|eukprot:ETO10109.1 Multicopper oxidase family [Reticulomyxa filosa]